MAHSLVLVQVTLFVLVAFLSTSSTQTVSQFLINDWQVETKGAPICNRSSCCCFNDSVNVYATPGSGELNVNGTVAGSVCNQPVKQDNLDPPTSYTFSQEFFGIDDYTFTLANATYGSVSGWSLSAVTSTACSFTLFHASSTPLPAQPYTPNSPTTPTPSYVNVYVGAWLFDSTTCNILSSACCCLVGASSIDIDPDGTESFFVSGPPSVGCGASTTIEQDDFPWPTSGTTSSSSVTVLGFLENQDNYVINITQTGPNAYSLYFQDLINPQCSMSAKRPFSSGTVSFMKVPSVFLLLLVLFLLDKTQ